MQVSTGSQLKNSTFCPECTYVCLMDHTTSNTHCWTQPIGFYNRGCVYCAERTESSNKRLNSVLNCKKANSTFQEALQNCEEWLWAWSCLSVCRSVCDNQAAMGRIFMKVDIWVFFENLSRKFKFKIWRKNGYFTWRPIYIFDNMSLTFS